MTSEREKRPVFIFLDEGVVQFDKEAYLSFLDAGDNRRVYLLPFPKEMSSIGLYDFQVVLFMEKNIFSKDYNIREFLFKDPQPVFIFVTEDQKFILDAQDGLAKWRSARSRPWKKRKKRRKIVFNNEQKSITICKDGFEVPISVVFVRLNDNDPRKVKIKKTVETIQSFLNNF